MNSFERVIPLKENPEEARSFVERYEDKTPEILGNFFSKSGIENYTILEINKTKKSIYGSVEIMGNRFFYKISKAESILRELQGYKVASEYPHEQVINHYFEDDYGVYLQNFCQGMDKPGTLLTGAINKSLLTQEEDEVNSVLTQTGKIFSTMGDLYSDGFTKSPLILDGSNDMFFNDRLCPGGRLDQLYANKRFNLNTQGKDLLFEDLLKYSLSVNQGDQTPSLGELLRRAKSDLSPNQPRHFVLSQGDPIEENMTTTGIFFDFETAGYNSLIQETAIFTIHNYFYGHYFTPKYSEAKGVSSPDTQSFAKDVDIAHQFDHQNENLNLMVDFPYPELKRKIVEQYVELVIKRVESKIPQKMQPGLIKQLQSAILVRFLGVRDLGRYEQKDAALALALVGHFSGQVDNCKKISDYLLTKFVSLKK